MDNLAHSAVAVLVAAALEPHLIKQHRLRLMSASVAIVNLPDIDVLMGIFGTEFYHFHHRGLTHSVFGLALLVPISIWILRIFFKFVPRFTFRKQLTFVVAQLLFAHFFLDWLTTYGVMFLYPYSFARFSYPLMFIVDPLLWGISLLGAGLLLKNCKNFYYYRKIAYIHLVLIIGLWGVENYSKNYIENMYKRSIETYGEIKSYPGPLAPLYWSILEINERPDGSHHYTQASFSFARKNSPMRFHPVPNEYVHDQLCEEMANQDLPQKSFVQYSGWGEYVVCQYKTLDQKQGCGCLSLKYSLAAFDSSLFGAFWIPQNNVGYFEVHQVKHDFEDFRNMLFD